MQTQHQTQSLASFLFPLDDTFFYERGPRYPAYAHLRESKLRAKRTHSQIPEPKFQEHVEERPVLTPTKEVKSKRARGSSIVAQSVPDFSSVLRKENRKPSSPLPPVAPPGLKSGRGLGGSRSVNSGEKRMGGLMVRKSYASVEELKGLASIARGAIDGESNRGVATRASTRNALRYSRQF